MSTGAYHEYLFPGVRLAEQQKRLRAQLEKLIPLLREWFKNKHDGSGIKTDPGFELNEFDETVETLADAVRVRRPINLWDAYKAVNRRYRELKLVKEIKSLILRAVRNVPERPLAPVARLARGDSELAKSAQRLIKLWPKLRKGEKNAEAVNWRDFEDLFIHLQNLGNPVRQKARSVGLDVGFRGSPDVEALCAYQNLVIRELDWLRLYFKAVMALDGWVRYYLVNSKLATLGESLFNFVAETDYAGRVENLSVDLRRRHAKFIGTMRKQKQRKKSLPESGTLSGTVP